MPKPPSPQKIKNCVRDLYARLATAGSANLSDAPITCGDNLARSLGYDTLKPAIPKKAWDLFAGCGNPLAEINLEPEWTVIDLGCGVGIDSQVAALSLQPPGRVVGIDLTNELLRLAKEHASALSLCHWVAADGEQLPLRRDSVHLVIANGSFNLMVNKVQALAEIYRVLKPGGYLALADLILVGQMEPITQGIEDAWNWCVAGALSASEYDDLLEDEGFSWWELNIKYDYGSLAAAHLLALKR